MITKSTERALALALFASLSIAVDTFGLVPAGRLGLATVLFLIFLKTYSTLAQASLEGLRVKVSQEGALEGRPLRVTFEICNPFIIPIAFVELSLRYPEYLKLSAGSPALLGAIPPRGCLSYSVSFLARVGEHEIGPLRAVFRDPLGIFRGTEIELGEKALVRVKPRESEKLRRALFSISRSGGMLRTSRAGEGLEFLSTREYVPGDDLRRVFWKALAKGRLAVKEFDRESTQYNLVLLALGKDMLTGPYLQTPLEHAARVIAVLSRYFAEKGEQQALYLVNGDRLDGIKMVRGRKGYELTIRALSSVRLHDLLNQRETSVGKGTIARELLMTLPRERVNIIAITTMGSARQLAEELKVLAESGRCSVYMFLMVPQFYGVETMSPMERAIFRIKSFQEILSMKDALKEIRKTGIKAVIVTPGDMARRIVMRLEMERM
ncbi:MAG: DUF58 domain-containing protein [Acidilobaceae archaeon]|nr:DUF58 domain-containing protein [Acidilobaceae archaeon]MDW7974253.1 DUF58 domain-containing protein [Sulfolobales archaeon]